MINVSLTVWLFSIQYFFLTKLAEVGMVLLPFHSIKNPRALRNSRFSYIQYLFWLLFGSEQIK
jgi:hypothetical protein